MEVWVYVIFGEYIPPQKNKKNKQKTKNVTHFIRIKFLVSFKEGYIIFLVKTHAKILSRKTNVPSVWERHYTFLTNFRAKKLKSFAKKNKTKPSKLLKFKVGHRKPFKKSFWSNVNVRNQWFEGSKMAFFTFLKNFEWQSWSRLVQGKTLKTA